ncbi:RxLR effector protein [Phytophthora megakarya]|uniref:RxLR effector protein n=1 Tax=Phytophthora megakarya TaxID=4795 RepID=A0A225WV56_9STRA|nr:RxLR effector protein [Phytophthora megakarya]
MRSLFWVFLWGFIYLSAYTEVTLAMGSEKFSELDSIKSTPVSFSKNMQIASRYLRRDKAAPTDTAIGVNNVKEEERSVVVDKLKGVGVNLVELIYKLVGKIVGQAKVDKYRTNLYQKHVEKLFKKNVNPDIYLIKANRETNPILKARFMRIDRMYKDLLEGKQKLHRS